LRVFAAILSVILLGAAVRAQESRATVRMRGVAEPPKGVIVAVDASGVTVKSGDTMLVLSWDKVAEVQGEQAAAAREFSDLALRAWRARSRIERLDYVAAEPLFDELFVENLGRTGATACVIAEGALRCRLNRGVQSGAIGPWLAWLEAAGTESLAPAIEVVLPPGVPPLVDSSTGLCPSLPPIWMRLPSVEAFAREVEPGAAGDSKTSSSEPASQSKWSVLGKMYHLAAAFECGVTGEVVSGTLPVRHQDPGIALVAQIVAARAGTPEVRRDARRLLTDRLSHRAPQWQEAWVRTGVGRSLLRESALEDRLLGVAQVLHVPARLRGASPYLSGVGLASAAIHAAPSQPELAWNLKKELMDVLPGHPALDLEAIRALRPSRPSRSKAAEKIGEIKAVPKGTPEEGK
jgi:hypothetical protein